jgi:hypothetical protein
LGVWTVLIGRGQRWVEKRKTSRFWKEAVGKVPPAVPIVRLIPIAALVAVGACVSAIRHEYDPESDRSVTYMHRNKIGRSSQYTFYVNGAKVKEGEDTRFVLRLEVNGDDWLRASNLSFLVDDAMVDFGGGERTEAEVACFTKSSIGSSLGIKPVDRCNFRETYEFDITWEQLGRLANARRAVMRVEGYEVYILLTFSADNIARFSSFVSRCTSEADPAVAGNGAD